MDVLEKVKKECRLRGYSHQTTKTYCYCIKQFLRFADKKIIKLTKKDVRTYLEYLSKSKSPSTLNTHHAAIKFMLSLLKKQWRLDIHYSKKPKRIPSYLTSHEVKKLLSVIKNKKHFLMIALLYGSGMRVSELCHLRLQDIDLENQRGMISKGKGNKQRQFVIPHLLIAPLQEIILRKQPHDYVFLGRQGNISPRTIYTIVKRAARIAGIKKRVHPHTLRHSFATHLVEQYPIEVVQRLLGHNNPATTQVYLHASFQYLNVQSPLDTLVW